MADQSNDGDGLFEVSEEALLNTDFDEDADFEPEEEEYDPHELDELAGDADIPLEQLRAMYGGPPSHMETDSADAGNTQTSTSSALQDAAPVVASTATGDISSSETAVETSLETDPMWHATEERPKHDSLLRLVAGDPAATPGGGGDAESEEEDDEDYMPSPPSPSLDWRREIRQGDAYQAQVPDAADPMDVDDYPDYGEEPVWKPNELEEFEVQSYLQTARSGEVKETRRSNAPDNEDVLHHLAECGFDTKLALSSLPAQPTIATWSEEECSSFEQGLSQYGKNFFMVQKEKVPHRSIQELIEFFYLWKKTERYDYFRRTNPVRVFSGRRDFYPVAEEQVSTTTQTSASSSSTLKPATLSKSTQEMEIKPGNGPDTSPAAAASSPAPSCRARSTNRIPAEDVVAVEPQAKRAYPASGP